MNKDDRSKDAHLEIEQLEEAKDAIASSNSSSGAENSVNRSLARADRHTANWDRRFEELRTFYREHGHSDVPCPYPENESLSRWVKRQRWCYAMNNSGERPAGGPAITPDRIARLMTLNFTWNLHERTWEKAYASLLNFKKIHGHTNVPADYEDAHLVQWVKHQRLQIRRYYGVEAGNKNKKRKAHSITSERVQRLHDIGFSSNSEAFGQVSPHYESDFPKQKTVIIPQSKNEDAGVFLLNAKHLQQESETSSSSGESGIDEANQTRKQRENERQELASKPKVEDANSPRKMKCMSSLPVNSEKKRKT